MAPRQRASAAASGSERFATASPRALAPARLVSWRGEAESATPSWSRPSEHVVEVDGRGGAVAEADVLARVLVGGARRPPHGLRHDAGRLRVPARSVRVRERVGNVRVARRGAGARFDVAALVRGAVWAAVLQREVELKEGVCASVLAEIKEGAEAGSVVHHHWEKDEEWQRRLDGRAHLRDGVLAQEVGLVHAVHRRPLNGRNGGYAPWGRT